MKSNIKNVWHVYWFFNHLMLEEDLNFHPDDSFDSFDYCLDDIKIEAYDDLMDQCFFICELNQVDIYDIALEVHNKVINQSK